MWKDCWLEPWIGFQFCSYCATVCSKNLSIEVLPSEVSKIFDTQTPSVLRYFDTDWNLYSGGNNDPYNFEVERIGDPQCPRATEFPVDGYSYSSSSCCRYSGARVPAVVLGFEEVVDESGGVFPGLGDGGDCCALY